MVRLDQHLIRNLNRWHLPDIQWVNHIFCLYRQHSVPWGVKCWITFKWQQNFALPSQYEVNIAQCNGESKIYPSVFRLLPCKLRLCDAALKSCYQASFLCVENLRLHLRHQGSTSAIVKQKKRDIKLPGCFSHVAVEQSPLMEKVKKVSDRNWGKTRANTLLRSVESRLYSCQYVLPLQFLRGFKTNILSNRSTRLTNLPIQPDVYLPFITAPRLKCDSGCFYFGL